jgi:peptidoglycan hydrolase-like protein with peptidoglycan-binding domain
MQFPITSRRLRTLALLVGLLAALTALLPQTAAAAPTAGQRSEQSTARSLTETPILAPGSGFDSSTTARQVRTLQRALTRLGYAVGGVDGLFGPRTEAAVVAFQTRHGLVADGVVGAATRTRLRALRGTLERGAGYAERDGSRRVRHLQRRLQANGFAVGAVDGRFGPRTEAAVIAFQRDQKLSTDGIAGPQTTARLSAASSLNQRDARQEQSAQSSTSSAVAAPTPQTPAPTAGTEPPTDRRSTQSATNATQTQPSAPTTQPAVQAPAATPTPQPPAATTHSAPATATRPAVPVPPVTSSPATASPTEPQPGAVPSLAVVVLITLAGLTVVTALIVGVPLLLVSSVARPRPRQDVMALAPGPPWAAEGRGRPPDTDDAAKTAVVAGAAGRGA